MSVNKHFNLDFAGGSPDLPLSLGDNYYSQDLIRDIRYLQDQIGLLAKNISGAMPFILSGGTVTKGTGDSLNISSGIGYVKYNVKIPNDSTSSPASVTTSDLEGIQTSWTTQTNMAIPSAVLDGSTINYVKIQYAETNSSNRNRAHAAGSYPVEKIPSFTISVNIVAPTVYDICLAQFTGTSGGAFTITAGSTPRGTLTSPKVNEDVILTKTSSELNFGFRGSHYVNLFRNPRYMIAQRGAGALTTANAYNHDGVYTAVTGSTFSVTQELFTLGQTTVPYNPKHYRKIVVTSSAGAGNFVRDEYRIEDVTKFSGETVILSMYAAEAASKPIAIEITQNFGTGGSPSAAVNTYIGGLTLTSTMALKTIPISVPSISGKVLGSNNNDYLQITIWMDAGSTYNSRTGSLGQQSGTFSFADICFNHGNIAMPAKNWIKSEQEWLTKNLRFYYRKTSVGYNYAPFFNGYCANTISGYGELEFLVPMRVAPSTCNISSASDYIVNGGGDTVTNSMVMNGASPFAARMGFNVAAGLTTGYGITILSNNKQTSWIDFSSEL